MYTAIVICAVLGVITFFMAIAARQVDRETRLAEVDELLDNIFKNDDPLLEEVE